MRIEILDGETVINIILADEAFAEQMHPGAWRVADVQDVEPEAVNPVEWLIDIGPFFDRFGAAKMAVLTSTDPGVKAILADTQVRKWIDLQRADVAQSVAYIGTVVAAVTPALQTAILTTPVSPEENLALRKLYFA